MKRRLLPDTRPSVTYKTEIHSEIVGPHDVFLTVGFYPDTKEIGEFFLTVMPTGKRPIGNTTWDSNQNFLCACWAKMSSIIIQLGHIDIVIDKNSYQWCEPSGKAMEAIIIKSTLDFEPSGKTTDVKIPFVTSPIDWAVRTLRRIEEERKIKL